MTNDLNSTPSARTSIWRHRDLRVAVAGRTISVLGNVFTLFALTIRIHDAGGGPGGIAVMMIAFAAPSVLLMGLAGHLADHLDSRTILVTACAVQAAAVSLLAMTSTLWLTYLLVVTLQVGQAFAGPTWQALIPQIVEPDELGRAVSAQQSLDSGVRVTGAALAGVVVGAWGTSVAMWVDAGTFVLLLVAAVAIRTRRRAGSSPLRMVSVVRSVWSMEGLAILRRDRLVFTLFSFLIPFAFVFEAVNVAEVFLVRDSLAASTTAFGVVQALSGIGAVLGAWAAGRAKDNAQRVPFLVGSMAGSAIFVVVAGSAGNLYVLGGSFALIGLSHMVSIAALWPMLTLRTAEEHRGKVFAAATGVITAATVLADGAGGAVISFIGPREAFIGGGLLDLAIVVALFLTLRARKLTSRRATPA